jgi:AmiR/NasT family two-component response regulator
MSLSRVLQIAGAYVRDTRQVGSALRQRVGLVLPTRTASHSQRRRAVVAQAMGVVMADCHCSADEAYRALLDTARETGRGLSAIATDVVESTAPCVPPATDL